MDNRDRIEKGHDAWLDRQLDINNEQEGYGCEGMELREAEEVVLDSQYEVCNYCYYINHKTAKVCGGCKRPIL